MRSFELFSLSVEMGAEIIRNGGEINRAKDTVMRINLSCGEDCTVFALPDLIIVQSESRFLMRKISAHTLDMQELELLEQSQIQAALTLSTCASSDGLSQNRTDPTWDDVIEAWISILGDGLEFALVFPTIIRSLLNAVVLILDIL